MRILIVEDEVKIAKAIGRALGAEGYAVDIEHDTDAAYAMASTEPYDILVVDRMLPGEEIQDGMLLIKRLRDEGITTPAILLTALGSIEQKTVGLDAGADDYLTKPFAIDELLARIRALLRRPRQVEATILHCGKLSLDITAHTAHFGDDELALTTKEFALLEYLLRSQGITLSKDQIIAHVWNFDADILPNTVEVYIKYLRDKIDNKYHVKYIKTVRGLGYKLEA